LYQYVANIETSRFALGGSYNIYLFDGAPASESTGSWVLDPNLIGPMGVLSSPGSEGVDLVVAGSIPLTRTLSDHVADGDLPDLTEANVVPYLTQHLVWRIAGPDGAEVDPDTVPDFEISVYASTATPPTEYALPVWSKFIALAQITKSKAGGATPQTISTPPESS
jgi:tyrosinase